MEMKASTFSALERHKSNASSNGKVCQLDYESGPGALPHTDMMWRYLWAYAENEIRKELMANKVASDYHKQGRQTTKNDVIERQWEEGSHFSNSSNKCRAWKEVMQALEFWSGKALVKAIGILQHITPKLKKASASIGVEFDEYAIMSKKKAKEHKVFSGMIERAKTCIAGMRRHISKENLQILTGVVALFVLPKRSNMFCPSCVNC